MYTLQKKSVQKVISLPKGKEARAKESARVQRKIAEAIPKQISIEGHEEDQKSSNGNGRVWVPDQLIIECKCGKTIRVRARGYHTICKCGADYTALVRDRKQATRENCL